jgi:Putative Actinobacterial Holin-X, holin superfamily III
MLGEIVALAQQRATAAARRAAIAGALGSISAVLFLFAAAALFCALFFWLEPRYGPAGAALIVAGVAAVLGLLAARRSHSGVGRNPRPSQMRRRLRSRRWWRGASPPSGPDKPRSRPFYSRLGSA